MQFPFVSIVVCTLNRKRSLKNCLMYLSNIDYPETRYEIIVVDGGSTNGTIDVVQRCFRKVKFITDKRIGISNARNTGAMNAKGQFVVFTDDDCIVSKDWVRNLIANFTSPTIGAVGGPVRLFHPERISSKLMAKAALGIYDIGNIKCDVKELITANIAIRRQVFRKVTFDSKLGRNSNRGFNDMEDIDFCLSLLEHGYRLLYVPNAVVYHNPDITRLNTRYILTRAVRGGISMYNVDKKRSGSRGKLQLHLLRGITGSLLLFFKGRTIDNLYFLILNVTAFFASL